MTDLPDDMAPRAPQKKRFLRYVAKRTTGEEKRGMWQGASQSFWGRDTGGVFGWAGYHFENLQFYMSLAIAIGMGAAFLGQMTAFHLADAPWLIGAALSRIGGGVIGFLYLLALLALVLPKIAELVITAFVAFLAYWVMTPGLFAFFPNLAAALFSEQYATALVTDAQPTFKPWVRGLADKLNLNDIAIEDVLTLLL